MLTLPTQTSRLSWHQQLAWRDYCLRLFRLVSGRRDFSIEFTAAIGTAAVSPEQRRFILNPHLLPVPPARLRYDPGTEHGRRVRLIRSMSAHEGGHVTFSAAKPPGPLGEMWNALEDERMERLVMRRYPELIPDFTFLGDVLAWRTDLHAPLDLHNACLFWRWLHDRPDWPMPLVPEHVELWETELRPRVEAAWESSRHDVEVLAAEILALIGDADPPPLQQPVRADGGGLSDPAPEEPKNPAPQGQDEADADAPGDGEPDPAGQGSADDPPGTASDPDTPGDMKGDPDNEGESGGAAGSDDSGEPAQGGASGRPGAQGNQSAPASPSKDAAARGRAQTGEGGPDPDADADALPSAPDPLATGSGVSTLPSPPPDVQLGPVDLTAQRIEHHARKLAPVLAPPGKPERRATHRTQGRFSYGAYYGQKEKYFRRRLASDQPRPFFLRLLVDQSTSMHGPAIQAAREAALLLTRAGLYAKSRVQVIGFTTQAREIVPPGLGWAESAQRIQGMHACGNTRLSSALDLALATPVSPGEHEIVAIICDGQLDAYDRVRCEHLIQGQHRQFLPVLIGLAAHTPHTWAHLFGNALPVNNLDDLSLTLHRALSAQRTRLT